jgi:1,4-dihydroxy-2-naphthoate octaprenyltransferase
MKYSLKKMLQGWVILSRPPFHIVGVLPFVLGTFLAYRLVGVFSPAVFVLGTVGVILIMLSTYHAGEYFDHREDTLSRRLHSNPFAGGSRLTLHGIMPRTVPLWTSLVSLFAALGIGILLQYGFKTGPYTLLLGALGALPGFFYSTEPVRLVKRGVGEIFIGFCYGWLPVASAFYIQTSTIDSVIHWMSLPIGFSIFNVILLNEFPDYNADCATGKKNLLSRIGKTTGKRIYITLNTMTGLTMILSPLFGVPLKVIVFFFPFFVLSLYLSYLMTINRHENPRRLEVMCGWNILVNIGTSLAYLLAYF